MIIMWGLVVLELINKIIMEKYKLIRSAVIGFLLSVCATAIAQNGMKDIKGVIHDTNGEPVIGASIVVQGTSNRAISDLEGKFTLSVPDKSVIEVSFVGFETQIIKVSQKSDFNIVLHDDTKFLDDIMVVGYGVQKKSDLTSAISSVRADKIVSTSVTSLDQGLQGRAAGVVVLNTSGQPGAGTSIRVRGTSSINGNNEPLYVIDGIPVISDANTFSTGATKNPALNPLININPNDIESIEILKDASATSIYGARGANGVVLVTTKHGKSGITK